MSFLKGSLAGLSRRTKIIILIAAIVPSYFFYVSGLDRNPPGFYIDEAAVSYNAYTIATSGKGEFGHTLPLYFPVFPLTPPLNYLGYVEPVQIYALAILYKIFSPSVIISRGLSATAMFFTALLIGWLAFRISKRETVGIIVAVTALLTPWLFEIGRLAFSASLYPFATALFLVALYIASRRESWTITNIIAIALALALTTYTYSIGRLLGPLFAFGLVVFLTNRKQIVNVLLTWVAFALTLVPLLIFHYRNPDALTGRLSFSVGYISAEKSYGQLFSEFLTHFAANISPNRLLFIGDQNLRHHINDTAPLLVVTLFLAIAGVILVLFRYWRDGWWRFVLFGLMASVVPASLTKDDFHMLRLAAFPVFVLVLTIPVYVWLLPGKREDGEEEPKVPLTIPEQARAGAAVVLVMLTLVQAVSFQRSYAAIGPDREGYFDQKFPAIFALAMERPERPIYLTDQYYYQAFWQALVQGVDLSNFERLAPMQRPPANSLVLSGEEKCTDCDIIKLDIPFIIYKTKSGPTLSSKQGEPSGAGTIASPRGIATDPQGNYYIADSGNGRILKFNTNGVFNAAFGARGEAEGQMREPHGVAVDQSGRIYVTDSLNHKLIRLGPDGSFDKEWRGPDSGFYGPRDVAVSVDQKVFIVDQGRNRIVRLDPSNGEFKVWGRAGTADGEFNDPTGIAVSGGYVFVTDTANRRVQVFDLDGGFVRAFAIPQWKPGVVSFPDVAFDERTKKVYISNPASSEVLIYDLDGRFIEAARLDQRYLLKGPSSMAIVSAAAGYELLILNSGGAVSPENSIAVLDLGITKPQ